MKEVWIITWHEQEGLKSGVHGVFEGEEDARKLVDALNSCPSFGRVVFKAVQWVVFPKGGPYAT